MLDQTATTLAASSSPRAANHSPRRSTLPRAAAVVLTLALLLLNAGCGLFGIDGNGDLAERSRQVSDFEQVVVENGLDVQLSVGEISVVVYYDSNLSKYIETVVVGDTLHIRTRGNENLDPSSGAAVLVSAPMVTALHGSGGSNISGVVHGEALDIHTSGGSDVQLSIDAAQASVEASGGSDCNVSGGEVTSLRVQASGGSDVEMSVVADSAKLEASGGSDIVAEVTGDVFVAASGGSDVDVYGNPAERDTEVSGGSSVEFH